MIDGLTLPLVIGAALADSINPCIFGVLIFLVAFMTKIFKKPKQMLIGGMVYTTVVYFAYLFIGLGILAFTASFGLSSIVYWIAAIIAILAGLLEIKDYFWYGKGFTLQLIPGSSERIKYYTQKNCPGTKEKPVVKLSSCSRARILCRLGRASLHRSTILSHPWVTFSRRLCVWNTIFIVV
jgi:hypothetical protein